MSDVFARKVEERRRNGGEKKVGERKLSGSEL
jgi:hypothetical protein